MLRGVPRAAWTCALVAALSAACWSVITPPFQAPDEQSHFAYIQNLAETGRLPTSNRDEYSPEELAVLTDLQQGEVRWHPEVRTVSSLTAVGKLNRDLSAGLSRSGGGGTGVSGSEPPLYYALAVVPYELGSGGTLLDRLELVRLLGAFLAGLTALFTFLFVRELLPGAPWAWPVGGLVAALMPLLGFTSGFVTPDAMLYAVCAAIFYLLARAFRRGLTWKPAVALGVLIGAGFLTKLNFVGLAPGVALGLVVLAFRGVRDTPDGLRSRRAFGPMALAMGIAISPICLYVLFNTINGHPTLGLVSNAIDRVGSQESLVGEIEYIWEFYLPRLPGMTNDFPGLSTLHQVWFNRTVGLYGWLDTTFPPWVYTFALAPAGLMALLALRTLFVSRRALLHRLPELCVYVAICVGLMALIGGDSHLASSSEGAGYAQPRYLMPLLPLAVATVVLAARGAGRRWGPPIGALIVTLFLAQEIFGQLLTVTRFYG
jgi:4-amino-4-deoxy-L-arabinose transferase-like glycosyltransferase